MSQSGPLKISTDQLEYRAESVQTLHLENSTIFFVPGRVIVEFSSQVGGQFLLYRKQNTDLFEKESSIQSSIVDFPMNGWDISNQFVPYAQLDPPILGEKIENINRSLSHFVKHIFSGCSVK